MSWFTPLDRPDGAGPHVVQSEALARIQTAATRPGLTILTGAAGTGKSTAVNLARHAHPGRVAAINASAFDNLRAAVDHVRDDLGTARTGDLIIFDDIGDMRPMPTAIELIELGGVNQLGAAHVIMTSREAAALVLAARLSVVGEPFPPRWAATGEHGTLIRLSWSPSDLDAVLRRTVDSERAEVLRQLVGNPGTPRELLHRAAAFLAEDDAAIASPDVVIVPDATGRLRVEPATRLPSASVHLGLARPFRAAPWIFFQRSRGLWLPAADALEELINDPNLREQDLQDFFESHPHVLARDSYARVIPHPVLSHEDGDLIPDFMLEPEDPDPAGIVELKLPSERVVVGRGRRLKAAEGVAKAIAQVREYRAHFEDWEARTAFRDRYGVDAYQPQAAILIGREPDGADPLQLRRIWAELPRGVHVHTYDDLLRKIRRLGSY